MIGILAGAVSGATLAGKLGAWFDTLPVIAPYGHTVAFGVVVVAITYASLVIGELAPKRIALVHADTVAARIARPLSAIAAFGRLDHAFNNAGTEGLPAPLLDSTDENWTKTLGTNLSGVYFCMREELEILLKQRSGSIVNCASIAGLRGFAGLGAYTASKHGVLGLTRSAALDYATSGVRINAVCPGVILTPMIDRFTRGDPKAAIELAAQSPMNRMGIPEEIADAVLWLCRPGATYVTGTELVVDGGWCAR